MSIFFFLPIEKKISKSDFILGVTGGPKMQLNAPPPIETRVMNPYTKLPTCPLVTKLDRMPKKVLEFRGTKICPTAVALTSPRCHHFDVVIRICQILKSSFVQENVI